MMSPVPGVIVRVVTAASLVADKPCCPGRGKKSDPPPSPCSFTPTILDSTDALWDLVFPFTGQQREWGSLLLLPAHQTHLWAKKNSLKSCVCYVGKIFSVDIERNYVPIFQATKKGQCVLCAGDLQKFFCDCIISLTTHQQSSDLFSQEKSQEVENKQITIQVKITKSTQAQAQKVKTLGGEVCDRDCAVFLSICW